MTTLTFNLSYWLMGWSQIHPSAPRQQKTTTKMMIQRNSDKHRIQLNNMDAFITVLSICGLNDDG